MSTSSLPVISYEPSLRPLVDEFWRRILGRHWDLRARERWDWLNARREHFLVREGDRILGNATLLRQTFVAPDGAEIPAGWITDFYVSPELKGRGMGKSLTRRLMEECQNLATFGQSQEARYCFSRLGWVGPDWVPLLAYLAPLRSESPGGRLSFRQVGLDDPALPGIWSNRDATAPAQGDRSVAALKARLERRPDADYEIWVAAGSQGPAGWVLLRFVQEWRNRRFGPLPVAILVDLTAIAGTDCREDLARFALRRAARRGSFAALAVDTPGIVGEALRGVGFRPDAGVGPWRVKQLPRKGFMRSPGADSRLAHPVPLSFYDCDAELTF